MLPALENVPRSPEDWNRWSFDHRDSHSRIRNAILQKYGLNLTDYQIDPINPDNMTQFLQNNSNLHDDMNSALGLPGDDLQDADLSNSKELEAWVKLHYREHYFAEQKLGV